MMMKPLQIGDLCIERTVILEPMAGVTDLPFRVLCREQGCGMVCTEMVSAKAITYKNKNTFLLMETVPQERPVSLQLFGSDPYIMAEAARMIADRDFDVLDVNMGCPVPKVVNNGEGSALMKQPEQLEPLQVPQAADVTLKDLAFAYGDVPIFSGLNLTAHPGDIIGITGPVACGKSTLGRVFLCEAPYAGSVRFGKTELSALTPRQVSATVGYLGHDPELSADTVRSNVLCGGEQDALPYLSAVALKDEVLAMEHGPDTVIGSGGTRLSGGQAQRLALARTLAHPRPVLVLDDPFSALDRSTEDAIFAELQA